MALIGSDVTQPEGRLTITAHLIAVHKPTTIYNNCHSH